MTVFVWPVTVLPPVESAIQLVYASRSPGDPWEGHRQVITPLTSEWRISASFLVRTSQKARVYRALMASLKGRFNQIDFIICDPYGPAQGALGETTTTAGAAGDEGDQQISIEVDSFGDSLREGHYISINNYLYMIQTDGMGTKAGGKRTYQIAPELREDVANNAVIRFWHPRCRCRLAEDATGRVAMHLRKFGAPTLELVEVLTR